MKWIKCRYNISTAKRGNNATDLERAEGDEEDRWDTYSTTSRFQVDYNYSEVQEVPQDVSTEQRTDEDSQNINMNIGQTRVV